VKPLFTAATLVTEDGVRKPMVACAACGRLIVATKDGRPRRHRGTNRLVPARRDGTNTGTCPGTQVRGDAP
jgi:hypothetical protein